MDFLDLIIVVILLVNVALGWAFGLVRRIVAFAGLFAGIGAATLTSANTSAYIGTTFGIASALCAHVPTYAVIVTLAILLFEVLGAVYQRYLDMLIAPAFDRLTGILTGAVVAAFEITVILIIGVGIVKSQLAAGYARPPTLLLMGSGAGRPATWSCSARPAMPTSTSAMACTTASTSRPNGRVPPGPSSSALWSLSPASTSCGRTSTTDRRPGCSAARARSAGPLVSRCRTMVVISPAAHSGSRPARLLLTVRSPCRDGSGSRVRWSCPTASPSWAARQSRDPRAA